MHAAAQWTTNTLLNSVTDDKYGAKLMDDENGVK
jgi:hypothetical protein